MEQESQVKSFFKYGKHVYFAERLLNMVYVPGCSYDLFISYATENNRDSWVEQFEKRLGQELGEILGRDFSPEKSIFFDRKELRVGQSFPIELAAAAQNSAMLIPILSPSYLDSRRCYQEKNEFFAKLPHDARPEECLAPILIRQIDDTALDKLYRDGQRFSFLAQDGQTPVAVGSDEWVLRLQRFSGQIKNALHNLRHKCKPVFLGKAPESDQAHELRAKLRAEIQRRHLRTVPEGLLAFDDLEVVRRNLQDAGLAIHFIGSSDLKALEVIEASTKICSGLTIAYQIFGERLAPHEQQWLNEFADQQPISDRYQYLDGKNAQELLDFIDEKITSVPREDAIRFARAELALVCGEGDIEGARHLRDAIKAKRPACQIQAPDFLENRISPVDRVRKWHEYLRYSDSLLFYHGATDRKRLFPIWETAKDHRRNWFLAQPDLDYKRKQDPDALWEVDQVVQFLEKARSIST